MVSVSIGVHRWLLLFRNAGFRKRPWGVLLSLTVAFTACRRASDDDLKLADSPKEAASQIERAFAGADPAVKQAADAAADAMRQGEYEKAVVSLQVVRAAPSVTMDQGLAVHSSTVALEVRLASAVQAGDENAKRAYQLLKAMKAK